MITITYEIFGQTKFALIADTQKPMGVERIWGKYENNAEATTQLFASLVNEPVSNVFFLGDLVGVSSNKKNWKGIDLLLSNLKRKNITTHAIAGNHEYMIFSKKGISNFYKRFPEAQAPVKVYTVDSISLVMLNTNFKRLNRQVYIKQIGDYKVILDSLQKSPTTKAIIVCTHQTLIQTAR